MAFPTLDDFDVAGKRVLLRVDINSPVDPDTKAIVDDNRMVRSLPTIRELADGGARLVLIAHQGDTLDYHNLRSLEPHAGHLADLLGRPVGFVDDVAGPEARRRIEALGDGEILLLDNLRYLTEEVTSFEKDVKLTPAEMKSCYLIRNLAPRFDLYVNDAFAAAHRKSPSMVGFQQVLPFAAGRLLQAEIEALSAVAREPARPLVFLLGGLKVSDAFSMMERALDEELADAVLTMGVTGHIFLHAAGIELGAPSVRFMADRSLDAFFEPAARILERFGDRVSLPADVAAVVDGERVEYPVGDLPIDEPIVDIGHATVERYVAKVREAATVFVNGPAGVYERKPSEYGTRTLWEAVAAAPGHTVIGGGDTVASAGRFIDLDDIGFVSTAGGAMVRYLSGVPMPLLEAMGIPQG
jgi:phosphoglycerate kinase